MAVHSPWPGTFSIRHILTHAQIIRLTLLTQIVMFWENKNFSAARALGESGLRRWLHNSSHSKHLLKLRLDLFSFHLHVLQILFGSISADSASRYPRFLHAVFRQLSSRRARTVFRRSKSSVTSPYFSRAARSAWYLSLPTIPLSGSEGLINVCRIRQDSLIVSNISAEVD